MPQAEARETQGAFAASRAALARFAENEDGSWSEQQIGAWRVPCWEREFWTARQRQAHSLHEVSYRACYKPQLPRAFITRLTEPGELVYDPFGGRGTTALEAALLGRKAASNDVNPLSGMLLGPRLDPPSQEAVMERLGQIPRQAERDPALDLSMFFHPDTESEVNALRNWFLDRTAQGRLDGVDAWIRMVATNRLTGHSPGFFSVYTLPPNQAASAQRQREINRKRGQIPGYRDTQALILKKTRQLLSDLTVEERAVLQGAESRLFTGPAAEVPGLASGSVALTVTSPPFLDVVQYSADNWLRCWFCGLDAAEIGKGITMARSLSAWEGAMAPVFAELFRVTQSGGHLAFEVGEVRKGTLRLEDSVLPLGCAAGFQPIGLLVNTQAFTKTAHIWGVDNQDKGTNSNRIVLFRKP